MTKREEPAENANSATTATAQPEPPRLTLDGPVKLPDDAAFLVELARAGNLQASRMLLRWAAGLIAVGEPLPGCAGGWLADALQAAAVAPEKAGQALGLVAGRGRPAKHRQTIRDGMAHAIGLELVEMVNREGAPLRDRTGQRADQLGPAFIGAFEIAHGLGIDTDPRALRDARYPRKRGRSEK